MRLSVFLRSSVALLGLVAGVGVLAAAAGAEELGAAAAPCDVHALVTAPLGPDGALPTAVLVAGPGDTATAVPGGWVADDVPEGAVATTATWAIPVVSPEPLTVWVADGDAVRFPLTVTPGCTVPAATSTLDPDCVAGPGASVTVRNPGADAVTADVSGAAAATLPVAPGGEAFTNVPLDETGAATIAVATGPVASLLSVTVDCPAPVEAVAEPVEAAPVAPAVEEPAVPAAAPAAEAPAPAPEVEVLSLGQALPVQPEVPNLALPTDEHIARQTERTTAGVIPQTANVAPSTGQVTPVPPGSPEAAPSLALTGADSVDLARFGAALVGLGLALQGLGRKAHFAGRAGRRAA